MATANSVLKIAAGEIGYNRWDDPNPGTKYGRYYAELTGDSYFGQSGVPYCAMFVTWVLAQAGQSCPGFPTAACVTAKAGAKNAGILLSNVKDAKPGDIVLFDWGTDGVPDHVGFVELNKGSYIQTIEGNTSSGTSGSQSNGGGVYRRTRAWSTVNAVIRVPYTGTSTGATSSASSKISVDGWWGPATTRALQKALGTTQDGIISGQDADSKKYHERCDGSSWHYGSGGSDCIKALQKQLGVTQDRYCGPATIKALQKLVGTTQDGYCGKNTVTALQKRLNDGWK